jgi:hypothetical protein
MMGVGMDAMWSPIVLSKPSLRLNNARNDMRGICLGARVLSVSNCFSQKKEQASGLVCSFGFSRRENTDIGI